MGRLSMPDIYKGTCNSAGLKCGICGKRHGFRPGEAPTVDRARAITRAMGWTFRPELGWICPCRHQCGNLEGPGHPEPKTNRKNRRRKDYAARARKLSRKRNKREIE